MYICANVAHNNRRKQSRVEMTGKRCVFSVGVMNGESGDNAGVENSMRELRRRLICNSVAKLIRKLIPQKVRCIAK